MERVDNSAKWMNTYAEFFCSLVQRKTTRDIIVAIPKKFASICDITSESICSTLNLRALADSTASRAYYPDGSTMEWQTASLNIRKTNLDISVGRDFMSSVLIYGGLLTITSNFLLKNFSSETNESDLGVRRFLVIWVISGVINPNIGFMGQPS